MFRVKLIEAAAPHADFHGARVPFSNVKAVLKALHDRKSDMKLSRNTLKSARTVGWKPKTTRLPKTLSLNFRGIDR
jgi:hypothetical protein